jgi:hypothetical protein
MIHSIDKEIHVSQGLHTEIKEEKCIESQEKNIKWGGGGVQLFG